MVVIEEFGEATFIPVITNSVFASLSAKSSFLLLLNIQINKPAWSQVNSVSAEWPHNMLSFTTYTHSSFEMNQHEDLGMRGKERFECRLHTAGNGPI
ncbi:hypothetical protein M0802_016037 [Mischocyttarus mexicanus]|nr:hypothetical protein M0802_016037 [Mischocyttarus mexicanus]